MAQNRVPVSGCPGCGVHLDAATGLTTDALPEPGDVTVCFYCAYVSTYAEDLTLTRLPRERATAVLNDPAVARARAAVLTRMRST